MSPIYWLTRSESDLPADAGWLAPGEVAVVSRLTLPKRKRDWMLGRWTAKQALSAMGACPSHRTAPGQDGLGQDASPQNLARLEVRAAPDGAPEAYVDGEPLSLSLSISHSGGRALCAILKGAAVGCDLEQLEARSELFVQDYFTDAEQTLVAAAPESDRILFENMIWSAKESALKALRVGLAADTRTVEVSLPGNGIQRGWRALEVRHTPDDANFTGWWRQDDGFVLTLVSPPPAATPQAI